MIKDVVVHIGLLGVATGTLVYMSANWTEVDLCGPEKPVYERPLFRPERGASGRRSLNR